MNTPRFKISDLVTVIKGEPVWYTHLDKCRLEKLDKTGTVVKVEYIDFNKDDLEWYRVGPTIGYDKANPIPDDFLLRIYSYHVRFPAEPDRIINISDVHLKLFQMEQ